VPEADAAVVVVAVVVASLSSSRPVALQAESEKAVLLLTSTS